MLHVLALAGLALATLGIPNKSADGSPAQSVRSADAVSIPVYPNSTCPVMGKAVSTRLFTDTQYGRIYLCCKACIEEVQADVEHAYKTAFPTTEKIENKVCPVTQKPIGKDAVRVEMQGRDFLVVDKSAATTAVEDSQATLAKLLDPKLVDVGNDTCPVTGEPAAKNTIAVIDRHIVHFASPKAIEEAKKEPAQVLVKARRLRAEEDRERAEKSAREPGSKPAGG
jgi:hypothetical protein